MRLSDETRKYHESLVRKALVRKTDMPLWEIQKHVEKTLGRTLSKDYVNKIRGKIIRRRAHMQSSNLVALLSEKKERLDEVANVLWEIVKHPSPTKDGAMAKIRALQELREWHNDYLQTLFDSGVFERELGRIKGDNVSIVVDLVKLGREIKDDMQETNADKRRTKKDTTGGK